MIKKIFTFVFILSFFIFSKNFADLTSNFYDPIYFPHSTKSQGEQNLYRYIIDHLDLDENDLVIELNGKGLSKKLISEEYYLPENQIYIMQKSPSMPVHKILSIDEPSTFRPMDAFIKNSFQNLKPNGKIVFSTILAKEVGDYELYSEQEVRTMMKESGFVDVHLEPLGKYVFPGMSDEKWPRLYSEDLIDYYIVSGYKPIDLIRLG